MAFNPYDPLSASPDVQDPLKSFGIGVGNVGGLPSGGRSSGSDVISGKGGGPDYGGLAGAAAPLLLSLFGPKNKEREAAIGGAGELQALSRTLFGQGKQLTGQGMDALGPVLKYLTAVAGGDPTALMEATQPERKRVLDQYDTAKKALQFIPRGGGQASSVMGLEAEKASKLSDVTAQARREGVKELGTLGSDIMGKGLESERGAAQALDAAVAQLSRQGEQTAQEHANLGSSIGAAVASFIPVFGPAIGAGIKGLGSLFGF